MRTAKAISHVFGVTLTLALLPHMAQAGVGSDIQRFSDTPAFVVGSGMSPVTVSLGDPDTVWLTSSPNVVWPTGGQDAQIRTFGMIPLGETGLTLAPVGSSGDVRWGLFNRGAWEISEKTTEIPEPAPLAILGIAILGLGFYRRYRSA